MNHDAAITTVVFEAGLGDIISAPLLIAVLFGACVYAGIWFFLVRFHAIRYSFERRTAHRITFYYALGASAFLLVMATGAVLLI